MRKVLFNVKPSWFIFFGGLLAIALAFVFGVPLMSAGAMIAITPILKVDKSGLEEKEKTFFEGLERRLSVELKGVKTDDETNQIISAAINKELASYKGNMEKLAAVLEEKTGFVALQAIVKAQGEKITAMEGSGAPNAIKNVRYYIEKWAEENKDSIQKCKAGGQGLKGITIPKAAITMTESASLGGSAYLPRPVILPGVIDLVRIQPTFWDRLRKGSLKANPLIWVNKYNRQGNAVFTAEGGVKPLISFELQTESSAPRKIPAKMKVSREMLDDIDYLASLIEGELRYEVDKLSNTGVLTGDGVAPNPKGVTVYAGAYSLATINGILNPNNSDAIRAAVAQIRLLFFDGPLTAFVNPADAAVMDLQKNSQGSYVLPPFTTADGRIIAGTPVVEDNNIAAGYLLLGDMSKYKVYMHEDFFIEWGWVNDDFEKNLVTVIGERRFHAFVSGNETGAFLYDTFNNIKTAIV